MAIRRRWRIKPKYRRLFFHGTTLGLTVIDALIGPVVIPTIFPGNYDYGVAVYAAFLITVALNELAIIREERLHLHDLIRKMGGWSNEFALDAVDELGDLGYLRDGTLMGRVFSSANLRNAYLFGADLRGAGLFAAHLEGADLSEAHLEVARFDLAHLESADLAHAYLVEAGLWDAHLEGADLRWAHLEGAKLERAYLKGAYLEDATFSTDTILPDGSHWHPCVDMERFTHPKKPKDRKKSKGKK